MPSGYNAGRTEDREGPPARSTYSRPSPQDLDPVLLRCPQNWPIVDEHVILTVRIVRFESYEGRSRHGDRRRTGEDARFERGTGGVSRARGACGLRARARSDRAAGQAAGGFDLRGRAAALRASARRVRAAG